jgi:hypothetical protein
MMECHLDEFSTSYKELRTQIFILNVGRFLVTRNPGAGEVFNYIYVARPLLPRIEWKVRKSVIVCACRSNLLDHEDFTSWPSRSGQSAI